MSTNSDSLIFNGDDNSIVIEEKDGLTISLSEVESAISFDWNPETDPQWNIIFEWGTDGLSEVIKKYIEEAIDQETLVSFLKGFKDQDNQQTEDN